MMDELDKLMKTPNNEYTPLEAAVVFLSGKHDTDARKAAAELARLRRIEAESVNDKDEIAQAHNILTRIGMDEGTLPERVQKLANMFQETEF